MDTLKITYDKDFAEMSYSEFCEWLDLSDEFVEFPLSYDEWAVVQIGERYFFYTFPVESASDEFYEVELVATLDYDINHDLNLKSDEDMSDMFECDMCGEQVRDDGMTYYWFKIKSTK